MTSKEQKTEKFDIRLSPQEEAVIRQAAHLQNTNPTNFIRQQAVGAAEAVVHQQTRFVVSDEQWTSIEQALNQPARVLPNLQQRLAQPDDWDQ